MAGVSLHLKLGLNLADLRISDVLNNLSQLTADHLLNLLVLITRSTVV